MPSASRARASSRVSRRDRRSPLGREAWLRAAREALVREGIRGVEVGRLARKLKATRGGFYWFFRSVQQLRDELLSDWERTNSAPFKAVLEGPGPKGMAEFMKIVSIYIDEAGYSPAWDSAVRDWARVTPQVAAVVRRVDDYRIDLLARLFRDLDYKADEAFVRARVMYFHQVGYYAMGVRETRADRLRLSPMYTRVLAGR
jgi:AcrR family transcriptional regulator